MMTIWSVTTEDDFLRCYDETLSDLHRYASRLVGGDRLRAEDLVQETYVLLLRRALAGQITEVGVGWLTVALRHRFLDSMRSAGREQRRLRLAWSRPVDEPVEAEAVALDPLSGIALTDRERAALTLRYVDDLTIDAVAAELGLSTSAIALPDGEVLVTSAPVAGGLLPPDACAWLAPRTRSAPVVTPPV